MKRDDVLAALRANRQQLRCEHGVKSLALFGSVARNQPGPNSDVDLLVEFDRPISLFGLVGTASRYKRESAWSGAVPDGSVTAKTSAKRQQYGSSPWVDQGSDAGTYENSDIHAIRIVLQEPSLRGDSSRWLRARRAIQRTRHPHAAATMV